MKKIKKLVLCARYDAGKVEEIQLTLGVRMSFDNCTDCGRKVMMMPSSRAILDEDGAASGAYCDLCFPDAVQRFEPQLMMTTGQFQEAITQLGKMKAKNN